MYTDYFQLKEFPFSIAPDPHFLFLSHRHQEGLAHLLYGINNGGGFIALTGEVGTGKTTLCQCLLQQLPENIDIALILNPKLNSLELLANICDELGVDYPHAATGLKEFTDLINQFLLKEHASGRRTVLLIDEAQNLSLDVLEQIRLLTNLETPKSKLLQIILVGQPELKQLLNQKALRQLNQRITARYHLQPLSFKETRAYINHRMTISGGSADIFKGSACRLIYRLTGGVPRLINILCDRALLGAYATGSKNVTEKIIVKAAKEALDLHPPRFLQLRLFVLLFCLISITLYSAPLFKQLYFSMEDKVFLTSNKPGNTIAVDVLTETVSEEKASELTESAAPLISIEPMQPANFQDVVEREITPLQRVLGDYLQLWPSPVISAASLDCKALQAHGFLCLPLVGSMEDILDLQRPAIMEFNLKDGQKNYLLFLGLQNGYLQFSGSSRFYRLQDVLHHWQGYYLVLWRPPFKDANPAIYPNSHTPKVGWLREHLAQISQQPLPEGDELFYDAALSRTVKVFQKQYRLIEDGIAGTQTLIHLQNQTEADRHPQLFFKD